MKIEIEGNNIDTFKIFRSEHTQDGNDMEINSRKSDRVILYIE